MTTAVATTSTALAMPRDELIHTLQNSLYPGATKASVELVLSYCQARGLDPMRKPVHIVPMWDKNAKQMRDTIMPGIGSYRIDASRTGQYAGQSEPEFGPTKTGKWGELTIEYPEWCRVTVRRAVGNSLVEFTAVERWSENYATASKDTAAPNAMWRRRPFGQLAKCAEAQALRKAFPEECGSEPTADELRIETETPAQAAPAGNEFAPTKKAPTEPEPEPAPEPAPEPDTKAPLDVDPETGEIKAKLATPGMKAAVKRALAAGSKTEEQMNTALGFTIDTMPFGSVNTALNFAKAA